MLLRAIVAFIALPGTVAFVAPTIIAANSGRAIELLIPGIIVSTFGLSALLWCVWAFYSNGKGTLAPWSPPKRLVVAGLYRFTRNPMYLAVLVVLAGWAITYTSLALGAYAVFVAVAFHFRVVLGEEPWLERAHGMQWHAYKRSVPRWIGFHHQLSDTKRDV